MKRFLTSCLSLVLLACVQGAELPSASAILARIEKARGETNSPASNAAPLTQQLRNDLTNFHSKAR
jgi:hypothetical protein